MKSVIWIGFHVAALSSCSLSKQNGDFTNISIQIIDMVKFNGLRIIEIAAVNYPDSTAHTQNKP